MASPWTLLHTGLHRVLKERYLVQPSQRLLIGVSGGQDSLCLAKLLLDLRPKWHWDLAIGHCDHRWRPDSAANAAFVQTLAQTWQVPYYQQTAASKPESEAGARGWRYTALTNIAQANGYTAVITGHTASDRAETLLFNLVRGSGADGLQALTWKRPLAADVSLVRPLLDITRLETAEFCRQLQLPVWADATNQDLSYARNRMRLEVFSYLRTHFNPQIDRALAQTAELLHADVDYLEQAAAKLLQQAQGEEVGLNRKVLQAAPIALQRRAIRQWLHLWLPVAPSFAHVEKVVALIAAPNRSQSDPFPGGAIARVEGDWIRLRERLEES